MTLADLSELCRDRELLTREVHAPNAFYGHDHVLRRYAGITGAEPLRVAIEHGIVFNDFMWHVDLMTRMPMFLCANQRRATMFESRTRKRGIAVGPMILYAAAAVVERPRESTLVAFPAHSTHHMSSVFDAEEFADTLERDGAAYQRVVVCMYWKDYLAGRARTYEQRGFTITTAGHMYDPGFLDRLVEILRGASAVVSNEVGTHLLYSVLLGRPVWLRRQQVGFEARSSHVHERDGGSIHEHPNTVRCIELFETPTTEITGAQREYVDEMTGRAQFRSPSEMRALLDEAAASYRRTATLEDRARDAIAAGMFVGRSLASAARRRLRR